MAGVLQTSQPLGERFTLPAANSPGNVDVFVVDPAVGPAGSVQPFRGRYFVDPLFAGGVQTGSSANPFTTIAAAFAFAAALAITAGQITIPNAAVAENVVMPTAGFWEITAPNTKSFVQPATIAGTVTINTTGNTFHAFTGLQITGAITGDALAQTRVLFSECLLTAALNLTASTGQSLRVIFTAEGPGPTGVNGFAAAAVTVAGGVVARGYRFSAVTVAADSEFNTCLMDVGLSSNGAGLVTARFVDVNFFPNVAFNALSGTLNVAAAPATIASLLTQLPVLGAGVTLTPLAENAALRRVLAAGVGMGTIPITNRYPAGMIVCEASLQLLVPGTAGAAVLNVGYVDLLGVGQTKPVTPALNIAGAAGSDVQGSYFFQHNGTGSLLFSVTGIVTPGPLSYSLAVSMRAIAP